MAEVRSIQGTLPSSSKHETALKVAQFRQPGCAAVTVRQKKPNLNAIIAKEARLAQARSLTVLEKPFPEVEALTLGM